MLIIYPLYSTVSTFILPILLVHCPLFVDRDDTYCRRSDASKRVKNQFASMSR